MIRPRSFFHTAVMLSAIFLAADTGANASSGSAKPAADEEINTLPKAKTRISELLTAAEGHATTVSTLTRERDEARTGKTAAETARDQAPQVANTNATERDAARAELATANTNLSTARAELATANVNLTAANTNVARLENLCGLRGINPKDLPLAANDDTTQSGSSLYEEWKGLKGAARTAFYRKHEAALDSYAATMLHEKK